MNEQTNHINVRIRTETVPNCLQGLLSILALLAVETPLLQAANFVNVQQEIIPINCTVTVGIYDMKK